MTGRGWLRLLLIPVLSLSVASVEADTGAVVQVTVSILPQQGIVEAVGGDRVTVNTLVQPGQDPHTYEPTPRQMVRLAESAAYFTIGESFEQAMLPKLRSTIPSLRVVDTLEGLELLRVAGAGTHANHSHAGDDHHLCAIHGTFDPHVWLNPRLVARQAATLCTVLSELDPEGASGYAARRDAFQAELAALDARLQSRFATATGRRFMVFHPSWAYFADAYGLSQVPIQTEGKAPSARQLARLITEARGAGVKRIYTQPQLDQRAARTVADAIGATLVVIDPLSPDYLRNLEAAAVEIAAGLVP